MAGTGRSRLAAGVLAVLSAVAAVAVHSIGAQGATPPTWGTFAHIATSDLDTPAARQTVAQNYSVVILRGTLTSALFTDLRQRRAGIQLFAYNKSAGLNPDEVRTVKASHPEWIARDAQRNVIHPSKIPDTTLADLTNPAFRAWQAQQIAADAALGADGVFLDTLGAYFPDSFYTGRPVVKGKAVTNAAWRDGSVDLIQRVKVATTKPVIANGFGLGSGAAYAQAAADADQLIAAADAVQIENFTRAGDAPVGAFKKAAQWDQDLAFLELLSARGKVAFAYTKVNRSATNDELTSLRDYAVGSFLEAFGPGRSYFGFDDGSRIPAVISDPQWANALGASTGTRSRAGNNGWVRSFQGGKLTVKVASAPVVSP